MSKTDEMETALVCGAIAVRCLIALVKGHRTGLDHFSEPERAEIGVTLGEEYLRLYDRLYEGVEK